MNNTPEADGPEKLVLLLRDACGQDGITSTPQDAPFQTFVAVQPPRTAGTVDATCMVEESYSFVL